TINGDIQFESNRGQLIAQGNRVGGNIQVFSNRGGATLNSNRINGNLQCKDNNPAPQGSGNTAASLEDQCSGLGGTGTASGGDAGGSGGGNNPLADPPTGDTSSLPAAIFDSGSNVTCRNVSLGAQAYANVSVP